jgi:multidrug efflux pump subunit AcrB
MEVAISVTRKTSRMCGSASRKGARACARGDVLWVERGYADPPRDLAYFKGERSIVLSVSITPGVNSVDFGERLTEKLRVLDSGLPIG